MHDQVPHELNIRFFHIYHVEMLDVYLIGLLFKLKKKHLKVQITKIYSNRFLSSVELYHQHIYHLNPLTYAM
jgi:hypothetical protein